MKYTQNFSTTRDALDVLSYKIHALYFLLPAFLNESADGNDDCNMGIFVMLTFFEID